jgi:hypothetical protein
MPPREVHGNTLEGVDEGEEEVMDEELLAGGVKGVEALHQTDQSITEFILALTGNAGVLEEGDEKLHDLRGILKQ